MSLATRCTACGTIFRVVPEQLKVSDGWVRCGRCDEVFNAQENLFDLERDTPPPWQPGRAQLERNLPEQRHAHDDTAADLDEDDRIASRFFEEVARTRATEATRATGRGSDASDAERAVRRESEARHGDAGPARHGDAGPARHGDAGPARHGDAGPARYSDADDAPGSDALAGSHSTREREAGIARFEPDASGRAAATEEVEPDEPVDADAAAHAAPGFVRAADARARWSTPRARRALAAAAIALALLLILQVGHHFRDGIAARHAALRPLLAGWCVVAGCRLEAPRRIEDISVENTALARAVAGTETYRLSVTLRNRGSVALSMPSIDLTLTDTAGQLISRRALAPADFKVAGSVVPPGGETALQVLLTAGNAAVSGYTVEAFYP